jgi:transcriptional regulator with XRE-family HTH domain
MNEVKPSELPAVFSRNLKAAREMRNMSQRALADKLHMSFVSVNRWENGIMSPTLETVVKIAEALDIPSEALLTEVGNEILLSASA